MSDPKLTRFVVLSSSGKARVCWAINEDDARNKEEFARKKAAERAAETTVSVTRAKPLGASS